MSAHEEVRPATPATPAVQEAPPVREPEVQPKQERPKEVAHDETPPSKTDHAFEPRGEWWTLCKHCGMAEAAHEETTLQHPRFHYYADDNPEVFE